MIFCNLFFFNNYDIVNDFTFNLWLLIFYVFSFVLFVHLPIAPMMYVIGLTAVVPARWSLGI